jgi:hypothetical protein
LAPKAWGLRIKKARRLEEGLHTGCPQAGGHHAPHGGNRRVHLLQQLRRRRSAFIVTQRGFGNAMVNNLRGLIAGRIYRSFEGAKAVLVGQFEPKDPQAAIMRSPEFAAHLVRLRDMVEASSPDFYEEAYTCRAFRRPASSRVSAIA